MEIEVLKKQKNHLEFILKGERHTFPNLLRSRLLQDPSVEFASYVLDHPLGGDSRFIIKTKGKTPGKALDDACKRIEKDLADFEKAVKKAVK